MKIEDIIYAFGKNNGLEVGICGAEPFLELRQRLMENNHRLHTFVEQDIEKRIYPNKTLENAKSIIVFLLPYDKKWSFSKDNELRGNISIGAVGEDYHILLKKKLTDLISAIEKENGFNYKVLVDTGPLCDREVGKRAGLGYIGKNGSLINKYAGSMVFIGYLITDLELNPTVYKEDKGCGNCKICIQACPSSAIGENGDFEPEKCISYLTQVKRLLTKEEMKIIDKQIYGCDICQKVCPKNKDIQKEEIKDINILMPRIKYILSLSNKKFKKAYGSTAMGWRGKNVIKRNAIAALGNIKTDDSVNLLKALIDTTNEYVKKTVIRSLINMDILESRSILKDYALSETDKDILQEIRDYI